MYSIKGITPVVAVIMLLLIVIAVVGGTYTFIQRTMQTTQNQTSQQVQHKLGQITTSFRITSVTGNKIYLRNSGMNPLDTTKLGVYVDGKGVSFQDAGEIGSGKVDKITFYGVLDGKHTLKITAAVKEDSTIHKFSCPSGWDSHSGHCYKVMDGGTGDWSDAKSECRSSYGYITTVNTDGENNWLVGNFGGDKGIGYTDLAKEGEWIWSGPTSPYENWSGGEPNDAGGEDCAFLSGGTWNDNDCSGEGREWICE